MSRPAGAMELIRGAKRGRTPRIRRNLPQVPLLLRGDAAQFGPYAKIQPLRSATAPRWRGYGPFLKDGTVDYIGSDHGPFLPEEKEPAFRTSSGPPRAAWGSNERLPLLLTAVRDGRLAFDAFLRCTASVRRARSSSIRERASSAVERTGPCPRGYGATPSFWTGSDAHEARETAQLYDGREVVGACLRQGFGGRCLYSNGSADATARGWGQWAPSLRRGSVATRSI
jgi:dihydropyrimidinase/allantoinase